MSCTNCGGIANIFNGYKNLLFKEEEVEATAKVRLDICIQCTNVALFAIVNGVGFRYCNKCKCPLSAKIRSVNEQCPDNKWK
jgi:hypothetical protein